MAALLLVRMSDLALLVGHILCLGFSLVLYQHVGTYNAPYSDSKNINTLPGGGNQPEEPSQTFVKKYQSAVGEFIHSPGN